MSELGFRNNAQTGDRFSLDRQSAGRSFPYGELPDPISPHGRLVRPDTPDASLPVRDNRPIDVRPDFAVIAS
jgi:hypothetical protein